MKYTFVFLLCFLSFFEDLSAQKNIPLLDAVRDNDQIEVDRLIAIGESVNIIDEHGVTALMWSVYKADLGIVRALISAGANTDVKSVIYLDDARENYYGNLQCIASGEGRLEVLKYLIEIVKLPIDKKGYSPMTNEHDGWTALQWGCKNGKTLVAKYLINAGADVNVEYGSCLRLGASHSRILTMLLDNSIIAARHVRDYALFDAIGTNSNKSVQLLLESEIVKDKEVLNLCGMLSIGVGNIHAFHLLYKTGIDTSFIHKNKSMREMAEERKRNYFVWYLDNPGKGSFLIHWDEANAQINEYYEKGNYKTAIELAILNVEYAKSKLGINDIYYAYSLNNLAFLFTENKNFIQAEDCYIKSIRIFNSVLGTDDLIYMNAVNNLGTLYEDWGKFDLAIGQFFLAKKLLKKKFDSKHPRYIVFNNNLARAYRGSGDSQAAKLCFEEILGIQNDIKNSEPKELVSALNNLGGLYMELGDFNLAKNHIISAWEIVKEIPKGQMLEEYNVALYNLAIFYNYSGKPDVGLEIIQKVIKGRESLTPTSSPYFANILAGYADILFRLGHYGESSKWYSEAEKLIIDSKNIYSLEYPEILSASSENYIRINDLKKAEVQAEKALKIYESSFKFKNGKCATALNNLGVVYEKLGNIKKAEKLFNQSLRISEKSLGRNNETYINALQNLAGVYSEKREYSKAENLYEESLSITEHLLGKDSYEYVGYLTNLATCQLSGGNINKAEKNYLSAIELVNSAYRDSDDYAVLLENLSITYFFKRQIEKCIPPLEKSSIMRKNIFLKNLPFLSKQQKENYTNDFRKFISKKIFIASKSYDSEIIKMIYDDTLIDKELLLTANKNWRSIILQEGDKVLNEKYFQWKKLSDQRNQMVSSSLDKTPALEQIELKIEKVEREIFIQLPNIGETLNHLECDWTQIEGVLSEESAVIEFISYNKIYFALILRPNYTHPKMVLLGTQKQLQTLIQSKETNDIKNLYTRGDEHGKPLKVATNFSGSLYDFVWSSIDTLMDGVTKIYYSPSGDLHRVAFAGLPIRKDSFLCQKYELHQIGTTRELVSGIPELIAPTDGEWLLAGGLTYDQAPEEAYKPDSEKSILNPLTYTTDSIRSTRTELSYLPGTKEEIDSISAFLNKAKIPHKRFYQNQAMEEYFHLDRNFTNVKVLHLGTHGFFMPAPGRDKEFDVWEQMGTSGSQFRKVDYPLLRSGLMLSGAQKAWTTGESYPDRMDGVWTAQEISQLNLGNIKLAVLSACETALGDVEESEGVYGLQRAFKLAGVEKLLVSLWKVDDQATNLYMRTFYQFWIKGGTAYTAYSDTQKYFMQHHQYSNPYYWAGFVLME